MEWGVAGGVVDAALQVVFGLHRTKLGGDPAQHHGLAFGQIAQGLKSPTPLEGLAPIIVQELLRAIRHITREEGLSAIIVEQHPQAILAISDSAAVLDRGTVVHSGTAASLREQPELLDRLLGVAR